LKKADKGKEEVQHGVGRKNTCKKGTVKVGSKKEAFSKTGLNLGQGNRGGLQPLKGTRAYDN